MNRNFKVITINGIRGIIAAIFIITGLIAGFVISPGWLCMRIWNFAMQQSGYIITMNLIQGIMLWSIIALTLYAINNRKPLIGFGSYPALSPEQIKDIMNRAKQNEKNKFNDIDFIKKEFENNKILKEENSINEKIKSDEKKDEKEFGSRL